MDAVRIDELRREISVLPSHERTAKARKLDEVIPFIGHDIIQAVARGVTWKSLCETVGKHVGFTVTDDALRHRVRNMTAKTGDPEAEESVEAVEIYAVVEEKPVSVPLVEPEMGKSIKTTCRPDSSGGHFIAMATSPDDRLFQLEHSGRVSGCRGGSFQIYEVDPNGRMHARTGAEYPAAFSSKAAAIDGFRDWGKSNGYEVKVNEK